MMKNTNSQPAPRTERPRRGCNCCRNERVNANRKFRRNNRMWLRQNTNES